VLLLRERLTERGRLEVFCAAGAANLLGQKTKGKGEWGLGRDSGRVHSRI